MSTIKFYSIEEFKSKMNLPQTEKAQVVKNPNTTKLFLSIGSQTFKCQQTIDGSKEMKMLVEDDNFTEACLANVTAPEANVLFTL